MNFWSYLKLLFGSSAGSGNNKNSPSSHGYPSAGPQNISVNEIMTKVFFMSDKRWEKCRKGGEFDYVVIGSSFCAWAFTDRMLKNKKSNVKILILERGEYFYPEYIQNLLPSTEKDFAKHSKTFHWKTSERMHNGQYIKWQNGMNNIFGGKSPFWRGWCPQPTREELHGWPESVKDTIEEYFPEAKKLLNVTYANEIDASEEKCCVFGELQNVLEERIKSCKPAAIQRVDPASLALKSDTPRRGRVQKLSVAEPLLNWLVARNEQPKEEDNPLEIKLGCLVEKIVHQNGKAVALQTNKGKFDLRDAKLILAMGVFPPTTLMLNSFPSFKQLAGIGTRCSAHFRTSLVARIPLRSVVHSQDVYDSLMKKISQRPEVAAFYIPGTNPDSKRQFHIQLSAVLDATPDKEKTMRHYPDVIPVPSKEQLSSSKEPPHIIFLCKNIGELDHANIDNWFRLNTKVPDNDVNCSENSDVTCNTTLQIVTNEKDLQVWDTLDESTFAILEGLQSREGPNNAPQMEYWHKSTESSQEGWKKERPPREQIRLPDLVHEASTMWLGDDESSPVGLDYRFKGVENVYLTGPALFPTTGSWNPTCTMAALAINLADQLWENNQNNNNNTTS